MPSREGEWGGGEVGEAPTSDLLDSLAHVRLTIVLEQQRAAVEQS